MSPQYNRKPHLTRIIIRFFNESEVALLAARQGIFNANAFSRIIQPQVEKITHKKVSVKVISTILLRYLKNKSIEFSFPEIPIKEVQEWGSRHSYSMIKVKFNQQHSSRYYVILAKLAIRDIEIVKLSISNGVLTMLVDEQQAGLALVALRSLLKKKRKFN